MSDCPECKRLEAIIEREQKVMYLAPQSSADGIRQLKEDVRWLVEQVRGFQNFAARVVNFGDSVKACRDAVLEYGTTPEIVRNTVLAMEKDYEVVFTNKTEGDAA